MFKRDKTRTKEPLPERLNLRARYLAALSVICFLSSKVIGRLTYPPDTFPSYTVAALKTSLGFIATVMLSIAVARIYFGLSDTRHYFKQIFLDSVSDILEHKLGKRDFVEKLSEDTIEKLHYELVKKSAGIEFPFQSSFYRTMRNDIEPLLGKTHYDSLSLNIHNKIKSNEKGYYIESKRTMKMVLHARTSGSFPIGFTRILRPIEGFKPEALYKLDQYSIDGEDLMDEVMITGPVALSNGAFKFESTYEREVNIEAASTDGKHINIIRNETLFLPMEDSIRWTVGAVKSLRQISIHCTFDKIVYPRLLVFGLQRDPAKFSGYLPKEPQNDDCQCYIDDWRGWMLPKHGFIITWNSRCD